MLTPIRPVLAMLAVFGCLLTIPGAARAAQSYDACQGRFIDSLPVTISSQGVWCLRKDVSTGITVGAAILIATNNVTIDCNDFKIGGLSAGLNTFAVGIRAQDRLNATVRNCNIRGFHSGVWIEGSQALSAGHVIENSRFSSNTHYGIFLVGDDSVIEHNKVLDTGGSTSDPGGAVGINAVYNVDVLDNLISNLAPVPNGGGNAGSYGIQTMYGAGSVAGNRVRGLSSVGTGSVAGIFVYNTGGQRTSVHDNDLVGFGPGSGVDCFSAMALVHGNTIGGFASPVSTCSDGGNHLGL